VSRAFPLSTTGVLTKLLLSPDSQACPACAAGIRAQVRAAIFDESFARTLAMTALPFGVLAAITAAIFFGLLGRRSRDKRREE
jgi:hypothetical protein